MGDGRCDVGRCDDGKCDDGRCDDGRCGDGRCDDGRCAVTVLWLGDAMRLLKPCNGGGIPFTNCHSPLLCGLTTTCRLCSLVRSTMEHSY